MKSQAQVVVIGGGVVGASVLYHLTKAGWADVVLVERTELTAGSTWHSAGGMHTLNGDPNVARLQRYTTELYAEIERVSGQDCISESLEVAFAHFPAFAAAGIQRVVNGPFTFSPDGNPLIGPIRGLPGYWTACGVMAGLSQGGGVGLSLANWITAGDPGFDVWAMDVARFGDHATVAYTEHQHEGAGELLAPVPDHVPQRVPARGARRADLADL